MKRLSIVGLWLFGVLSVAIAARLWPLAEGLATSPLGWVVLSLWTTALLGGAVLDDNL